MVIVCIPSIGGAGDTTRQLIETLQRDPIVTDIMLLDNSPDASGFLALPSITYGRYRGSIYQAWNAGLQCAASLDAAVLLCNDDVTAPEGLCTYMAAALDASGCSVLGVDPSVTEPSVPGFFNVRRVRGTYRHGGITGHCFMVQPGEHVSELLIDPRFQWWGGDDDLAFKAERAGLALGRCEGLGVRHVAETTASQHSWTAKAKDADRELMRELWGPDAAW